MSEENGRLATLLQDYEKWIAPIQKERRNVEWDGKLDYNMFQTASRDKKVPRQKNERRARHRQDEVRE